MKILVVLSFDLPDDRANELANELIPDVIQRIDPPALPFFDRAIRLVIDPLASRVEEWLDEGQ